MIFHRAEPLLRRPALRLGCGMRRTFVASLRSFPHAWRGLTFMLRSQPNARIHLLATLAVCGAGIALGVGREDWLWLTLAVVLVWSAEALNTALEQLADAVHPERHPGIGRAKDVAAAAVFLSALGAAVIGVLVFGPHLLAAWR
jgi:diacylglycerol kinase (ATP)